MNDKYKNWLENNLATIEFLHENKITLRYLINHKQPYCIRFDNFNEVYRYINLKIKEENRSDLYVEISGRQTGKTTRMIDDMVKHIKNGGTCCLYTMSHRMRKHIVDIVNKKVIRDNPYTVIFPHEFKYLEEQQILKQSDIKNYFDEFDFLDLNEIFFDPNGYYCTTSSKLRNKNDLFNEEKRNNDFLLKLIWEKNLNYVSYKNDPEKFPISLLGDKTYKVTIGDIFK